MSEQESFEFNRDKSERAKDRGMAAAAISRHQLLHLARRTARELAKVRPHGEITADDVQQHLILLGYTSAQLGPAAGSIFRGDDWIFSGRYVNSTRVSNHSRLLRVWRLR